MNKTLKRSCIILTLIAPMLFSCGGGSGGGNSGESGGSSYTGEVKTIVIDGGGDIGNFNTTASQTQSEANPYPYKTLENLCAEWTKTHPQYNVQINKTSMNGDRGVLVPLLNQHKAPDITYENGTVINTDLGKDYYVNLTDYFDKANPYVEGNEHWSDIYNKEEFASTMATDGDHYYVNLEKVPVGIMVNKNLLKKANISTTPTTYGEFIAAAQAVNNLGEDYEAYSTTYNWYDIALESNMFSDILSTSDVLRQNGIVDQEELVRAYVKNIWQPSLNAGTDGTFEGNKYYDYISLCADLGDVQAPLSYSAHSGFIAGNLAFLEVTGKELRKLSSNKSLTFDWEVIPFPDLTTTDYAKAANPSVRGSAGLATAWFVTKAAEDKGTVEGCIDLMMYLTAPEQNNQLIGDLKGGIPLNPTSEDSLASYLQPLVKVYNSDMLEAEKGDRCYWGAVNSWGVLGYEYNTAFIKTTQDIKNGVKTRKTAASYLSQIISNTTLALRAENEYDETKW